MCALQCSNHRQINIKKNSIFFHHRVPRTRRTNYSISSSGSLCVQRRFVPAAVRMFTITTLYNCIIINYLSNQASRFRVQIIAHAHEYTYGYIMVTYLYVVTTVMIPRRDTIFVSNVYIIISPRPEQKTHTSRVPNNIM